MHLGTHYYVLSLSTGASTLFEAFRGELIMVENRGFPVEAPSAVAVSDLARAVDEQFDGYYSREPLGLVVVGTEEMLTAFDSVTSHGGAVIGRIVGDHAATSPGELGRIVWPVVREAMSGILVRARRDLEACEARGQVESALPAVLRAVLRGAEGTLLVESNYHLRGRIDGTNEVPVVAQELDVREVDDDVVDVVINRILKSGGDVVFAPDGSLEHHARIVLFDGYAGV